ncbi:MAG: glycine cleavage system protein GcvH [Aeromicrobium sp.]
MVPEDLYYSEEHEWLRLEGDVAIVGITDYAQDQLGDIVYVDLPEVGATVELGDVVGELESTKSVSEIYSPVSGEVIARNAELDGSAELINTDPYGEGWLFKVRASESDATEGLLDAEAYVAITGQ